MGNLNSEPCESVTNKPEFLTRTTEPPRLVAEFHLGQVGRGTFQDQQTVAMFYGERQPKVLMEVWQASHGPTGINFINQLDENTPIPVTKLPPDGSGPNNRLRQQIREVDPYTFKKQQLGNHDLSLITDPEGKRWLVSAAFFGQPDNWAVIIHAAPAEIYTVAKAEDGSEITVAWTPLDSKKS